MAIDQPPPHALSFSTVCRPGIKSMQRRTRFTMTLPALSGRSSLARAVGTVPKPLCAPKPSAPEIFKPAKLAQLRPEIAKPRPAAPNTPAQGARAPTTHIGRPIVSLPQTAPRWRGSPGSRDGSAHPRLGSRSPRVFLEIQISSTTRTRTAVGLHLHQTHVHLVEVRMSSPVTSEDLTSRDSLRWRQVRLLHRSPRSAEGFRRHRNRRRAPARVHRAPWRSRRGRRAIRRSSSTTRHERTFSRTNS